MDEAWRAPAWLYPCLLAGSGVILARKWGAVSRFPPTFVAFKRNFSQVFFLALVATAAQNLYAEALYKSYGMERKSIALLLLIGQVAAMSLGTIVGLSADSLGRKQICRAFAIFTTVESALKQCNAFFLAQIFSGLAASVLPCVFEAWMISEHEKHGFRHEWIAETLMSLSYGGAIVSLGSTVAGNFLVPRFGLKFGAWFSAGAAVLVFVLVSKSWSENLGDIGQEKSSRSLLGALRDKKVVTLGLAQGILDASIAIFWLLWIPTIVADGRAIHVGSIYSCLMAALMVGTGIFAVLLSFSWFNQETILSLVLAIASICFFVPAYDYQEISTLVSIFCIFQLCVGMATPSLAYLRASWISSSHRAGVYTIFRIPTHLALMLFLTQGPIRQAWDNSAILYICSLGNLAAAVGVLAVRSSSKKL